MRVDNTRAERAARVRAKKLAAGMVGRLIYLPLDTLESLRQAFEGPAGGVAWEGVAAAALRPAHAPDLPGDVLDELREAFPDQGGAGIDWQEAARAALVTAGQRKRNLERKRAAKAAGMVLTDRTGAERQRRYKANKKARAAQATTGGV